MSQSNKRKRSESKPASGLPRPDQVVLNVIKSKGENAINKHNIQHETKIPTNTITKCLNNLKALSLINEIPHGGQFRGKHYIATEFFEEPDPDFNNELKEICLEIVKRLKVATAEGVYEYIKKSRVLNTECTSQKISEMLGVLVLDNLVMEVKSTGQGEYHSIPVGNACYRRVVGNVNQGVNGSAMGSVPCGVCPVIRDCTPDGIISPTTCVYYAKWLDF